MKVAQVVISPKYITCILLVGGDHELTFQLNFGVLYCSSNLGGGGGHTNVLWLQFGGTQHLSVLILSSAYAFVGQRNILRK